MRSGLAGFVLVLAMIIIMLVVMAGIHTTVKDAVIKQSQRQEEIRNHYDEVSATYEILLDGNKVDADAINVDWYKIEIDDTQRRVFLTAKDKKNASGTTVIPMTIPIVIP